MKRMKGGAIYEREDGTWDIRISTTISTGTKDKSEARRILRELIPSDVAEGSAGEALFNYLAATSRELDNNALYAREQAVESHLLPAFRDMSAGSISSAHTDEYRAARLAEGGSATVIEAELRILREALDRANKIEDGIVPAVQQQRSAKKPTLAERQAELKERMLLGKSPTLPKAIPEDPEEEFEHRRVPDLSAALEPAALTPFYELITPLIDCFARRVAEALLPAIKEHISQPKRS